MTDYMRAPQITERETSHLWVDERTMDNAVWEDCGPCTALECVIASGHNAPATHYEMELFRQESGYGAFGGTNVPDLCAGAKKRYGVTFVQAGSWSDFRAKLKVGWSGFVIISPSRMPADHVLRKYVGTGFMGLHFEHVENDGQPKLVLLDPAAPKDYAGDRLSWADLERAYVGGAGLLPLALEDTVGIKLQLPDPVYAGTISFPAGTKAYRVSDNAAYVAPQDVNGREASTAIAPGGAGYLVDLSPGGVVETHFVHAAASVVFVPNRPPATPLGPGVYEVK